MTSIQRGWPKQCSRCETLRSFLDACYICVCICKFARVQKCKWGQVYVHMFAHTCEGWKLNWVYSASQSHGTKSSLILPVWPACPEIIYLRLSWPLGSQAVHHAHPGFMWLLGSEHRPASRLVHWAISLSQGSISVKSRRKEMEAKENKEKKDKGNLRILLNCTDTRKQASSLSPVHLSKWGI